jgi:ribonuclease HI
VDRQTARDEVWRLGGQLAPSVDRPEFVGLEQPAEPPGANRAELEAAADALLAHSLAGRRTDDELLGAALALWDEHEDSMVHGDERLAQQGITGRRAQTKAMLREVEAWKKRHRLAWRRWFDQHAEHGSATGPGQR